MAHSYKVGDTVVPNIGPHKGHPHTVIHVHSTGEVNIKPKGLHRSQNRYRMGAATAQPQHLNPHTVAESASCPDCGCDPCKCKVKLTEELSPAHKGSHQYIGKIGGKTYVVPHATYSSFEPEHKKPLPHSTVTSREHVAKHNKNMSPEEIDKIHQHIQQVHKESVEEGYTTMKGKESFMKKKPLDVKYGSRWQVMSHGKTMERPTKEEVELDEAKDSFGYPSHSYDHVMKKLKSGEWETSYDLKKGKHTTITDKKTGKQRMIHVKEDVALDEASLKDACWKGYEAIGMKEKGGKKVPNCVPVNEQTPSGGFGGPESAGVPMGGDISTKTVTGSDTAPKSTRKQEILKDVMKSAKEKQKQKIGGKSEFEKDPEYHPLVITQQ